MNHVRLPHKILKNILMRSCLYELNFLITDFIFEIAIFPDYNILNGDIIIIKDEKMFAQSRCNKFYTFIFMTKYLCQLKWYLKYINFFSFISIVILNFCGYKCVSNLLKILSEN